MLYVIHMIKKMDSYHHQIFSETELSAMKKVSQWQILDIYQQDEVENGIYDFLR